MPTRGLALVIEDDAAVADVIVAFLSDLSVRSVVIGSPDAIPADLQPDIVITDIVLRDSLDERAVRTFLARLRARFGAVPLVLATAHVWPRGAQGRLPVDAIISKPFDLAEFEAIVLAAVGRPQPIPSA